MAPIGIRADVGAERRCGRHSGNDHPNRPERIPVLTPVIERQLHRLSGVELPESLHVEMTLVSPASARGIFGIDDTPALRRVPLPDDPGSAHTIVIVQPVRRCPRSPAGSDGVPCARSSPPGTPFASFRRATRQPAKPAATRPIPRYRGFRGCACGTGSHTGMGPRQAKDRRADPPGSRSDRCDASRPIPQ